MSESGNGVSSSLGKILKLQLSHGPDFTPATQHTLLCLSDGGATTDQIWVYIDTDSRVKVATAISAGDAGAVEVVSDVLDGNIHELLATWQEDKLRVYVDGTAGADDVAVDIPTGLDRLYIGSDGTPAYHAAPTRIIDARLSTVQSAGVRGIIEIFF